MFFFVFGGEGGGGVLGFWGERGGVGAGGFGVFFLGVAGERSRARGGVGGGGAFSSSSLVFFFGGLGGVRRTNRPAKPECVWRRRRSRWRHWRWPWGCRASHG